MIQFAHLVRAVEDEAALRRRTLLGVCGPPGVGKSTVAEQLATVLGDRSIVLGMDGFHLANSTLDRMGLRDVKGAPETFDVDGLVALLRRVRQSDAGRPIHAPVFDRSLDAAVAGAVEICDDHDIVIVEGNYLLMDGPWADVRSLLDLSVYLRLDDGERRRRLIDRHIRHGRTPEDAAAWVDRSDEANARLIAETAHRADHLMPLDGGSD